MESEEIWRNGMHGRKIWKWVEKYVVGRERDEKCHRRIRNGVQKGPSNRLGLLIEKKKEKRKKIYDK